MISLAPLTNLPPLESERLLLRRLCMRDAADLYDYSRDPEVARHVLWSAHTSPAESRSYIRYMLRRYRLGEPSSWGIVLKSENRVVGTIGFMWIQEENASAEVGYSLSRSYWNQGIMTEALRMVLDFGFHKLKLNRIEAQHEVDNPASGAVMRKAGMAHEGILRQRLCNKGRFVDVALYAALRSEYVQQAAYSAINGGSTASPFR